MISQHWIGRKNLRKTVKKFTKLPKLSNSLAQKTSKRVIIDVKTRWNSLLHIIRRFVELRTDINKVLVEENIDIILSNNQIGIMIGLVEILGPVEKAVLQLSSKDCNLVTADLILEKMFNEILLVDDSPIKTDIVNSLMSRIVERRTIASDILFFFQKEQLGNPLNRFYKEPNNLNRYFSNSIDSTIDPAEDIIEGN